ncbi:hypothetical protein GIB67_027648 [Kingdonia uniflora]|uniref:Protein kinase domain-containing protein n=1 Tax=Kingdonia uniflora TaxID=39325 RepID=A0A7J7NLH8_9MAGN|nr:hypothetical protein GIB67_027648 [Kingdonia uniflora]
MGQSLANLLYDGGVWSLSWEERLQVFLDIVHGAGYLHEQSVPPIVYRDIKYANILLDKSMRTKVELELARFCQDEILQCNQEFLEEFDRMRVVNEDREDQHVNVHFKFAEATHTADDLARKIKEKDIEIKRAGAIKEENGRENNELKKARDDLSTSKVAVEQLTTTLPTKDMEFWMVQQKCDELNEWAARLKTKLAQANFRARNTEAREHSRKN